MAGNGTHDAAHVELGRHALALFLTPDSDLPIFDIHATAEQRKTLVRDLHAALADRQSHL